MSGRDASSGWREEYDHLHTPMPDGGMSEWVGGLEVGDRAHDREGEEEDAGELIIIRVHNTRADQFVLEELKGQPTVASENPQYSPSAPVVEAVYINELGRVDDVGDIEQLRKAVENRVLRSYSFPADRLNGGDDS